MAELREAFPVLQNPSTKEGEVLDRVQQGQAGASKNGLVGFSFVDQSGNVILPVLTAEGKVPVDFQGSGTIKRDFGSQAGTDTMAEITDATLTLTAEKIYRNIHCLVACRRDALFQIVQVDDVTETVLAEMIVGPGQYTFLYHNDTDEFTAGATGTQELQVKGKCFEANSDIRATISVVEQVAGA